MSVSRKQSEALFSRAAALMPGGVSSPVRAFGSVGGSPVYFAEAKGSRFIDEDGNHYVDFCLSWGPLILGHAHPLVVDAVKAAAGRGLSFGAACRAEIDLAERLLEAFAKMDRVRFVSSGTEAVMTAIRLARGVSGRSRILKFDGGYHGHSDSLLVKAGSGLATLGTSSSKGVPESFARETSVCRFDDEAALDEIFTLEGSRIAAAIVEPLPANNGLLSQRVEWLRRLRELCTQHGCLLIFDEVISGFRLGFGGYGALVDVDADLVTLGKIIGGGLPVGALMGRAPLMDHLAPLGDVYQAGTLSGNPVSLAAGRATLDILRQGEVYSHLESLGARFDETLAREAEGMPHVQWRRVGSLIWLHLAEGAIPRRADAIDADAVARFNRIHGPLLDQGIYLPPSAYEVAFLCAAHSYEEVDQLASSIARSVRESGRG